LAVLLRDLRQTGAVVEVPLAPLNVEETAALAARVANRELDSAYLRNLYGVTEGNPLFVVESVRANLEEPQGSPPHKIHAVISARLAQLSQPAFELAGLAGTIGRAFSFDLLAKATDWDEDSLSRALEELWQRRIISGQGAGAYDFTHDRLREVAYAELSPVRQRFLHRRVAHALEELHAGELESVSTHLAAHYDAAGMLEEAIRHYQAAAAEALRRYADAEAAGLIRRALTLCGSFRKRPGATARSWRSW
jgi:predicted ATPase